MMKLVRVTIWKGYSPPTEESTEPIMIRLMGNISSYWFEEDKEDELWKIKRTTCGLWPK